ncbi:MAG: cytochrome c peroxidase [Granulosicoccaceae bacterium]
MKTLAAVSLSLLLLSPAWAEFTPWTDRELRVLQSFSLSNLGPNPPQPSNAYADNEEAARFGERLFFDKRLSANGELSCASCHDPELYFTDAKPRGVGVNATGRNTMTVVGAAYQRWFYWDGRRDSLWSQALIPFEAPDEMGSSRTTVIKQIVNDPEMSNNYREIFGDFPRDLDVSKLPKHAGPYASKAGKESWHSLARPQQRSVNQVYANLGKAIGAYERTLQYAPSRFDRYLTALAQGKTDSTLLNAEEKAGARLFIDASKTQCLQCHNGPTFSNGDFHNIGTGNFSGKHLDFGRVFGLQAVLIDEFNCLGPYSDAKPEQCTELRFLQQDAHVPLEGAFKTPSLRNVSATAPYFHDGSRATLEQVLAHYNQPPDKQMSGGHELRPLELTADELAQLASFLSTLAE